MMLTTPRRTARRLTAALGAVALCAAGAQAGTATAASAPTSADPVVLVQTAPGYAAAVAGALPAGASTLAVLSGVDVVVVRAAAAALPALRHVDHVAGVSADAPVQLASTAVSAAPGTYDPVADPYSLLRTRAVLGAKAAWRKGGTGEGIDVAVIDTGVAAVSGLSDTGRLAPGVDLSVEQALDGAGTDAFGHGTHMAGIIAGRDPGQDPAVDPGPDDRFLGIAPGARVVPVRVGDRYGMTDVSQVMAALDWVVRNAKTGGRNVRVVNLSFGSDSLQGYELDPLAHAAERAWHAGLVVVASAGNGGRKRLSDPAYDPYLLAVGAADTRGTTPTGDDVVPTFSNRGDGVRGPDVVAPGRSQQSLRAPGSHLDVQHGARARVGERYFRGTGTSQAAAVVSGAAAVLLSHRPGLTPDQVKRLLTSTARPLPGTSAGAQGAGLVDLGAAVSAPTPSDSAAQQAWSRSLGLGSVQAARGTPGLLLDRVRGSIGDYGTQSFTQTNDPAAVAAAAAAARQELVAGVLTRTWDGTAWDGGAWNGSAWDGSAWDGSAWDGSAWDGSAWDGSAWDGSAWDGSAWDGHGWG